MNSEKMIDGVKIVQLKKITDDRGFLMEIFRQSLYGAVRQVYITTAKVGIVKDKDKFHCHDLQTDRMTCIIGNVLLVLVDTREKSKTKGELMEIRMGEDDPKIIIIPPKVLHAFKNVGKKEAAILNCINQEYNPVKPDEIRIPNKIYDWDAEKKL